MVYWEMLQWHQPVKRYPFEGQSPSLLPHLNRGHGLMCVACPTDEHAIYHDAGQRQLRPATAGMRRQWGDDILDLIEKLWAQSPQDRPKMGDCIAEVERLLAAHKKPRSK